MQPKSPNHALQRTAPCVTAPASAAAFPPTVQVPRRTPPSLSLRSLGASLLLIMDDFNRYFRPTALIVVGMWLLAWIAPLYFEPLPERRGQFGDMFGSINALFSGLALAGVVCALLVQSREIREQKRDQQITQATLQKQADALLLAARIQALTNFIERDEPQLIVNEKAFQELQKQSGRIHSSEQPQQARDVYNGNVKLVRTKNDTLRARLDKHRSRLEELYAQAEQLSDGA